MSLPSHLKKYVVEQDYSRYTPVDQASWRYIMRQLKTFLAEHAHPCYVEGLKKTGIEVDRIPRIEKMSEALEKFGWRAVPVSGFIPPAAFMELQSLGYLPIASDMRTLDHLLYTPAPDIVHEAAGHAPILVDPDFAAYLKRYAQVARKAIISKQDMDQYEAIRALSDLKEDPASTPEQIEKAENHLAAVTAAIDHVSEAALLSRMNWWTAEYGLIGSLEKPRIFGAGLLSSVGEARDCLKSHVKKIPLTIDCINYSYDITEPQPQLFVTPDFQTLGDVLDQLAERMAFRHGGQAGLEKALRAATVNTVELNSGIQVSARLTQVTPAPGRDGDVAYLQFTGPAQLCLGGTQIAGQGTAAHPHGFGTPVGPVEGAAKCLSELSSTELSSVGLRLNESGVLKFRSGVKVSGRLTGWLRSQEGKLALLSFEDCTVTLGDRVLFQPEWGSFDMAVGSAVTSVFGGPADRESYGSTEDFVAKVIPRKAYPPLMRHKHELYQAVRDLRENPLPEARQAEALEGVLTKVEESFPHEWLLRLEILEQAERLAAKPAWKGRVRLELENLADRDHGLSSRVFDGLRLVTVP